MGRLTRAQDAFGQETWDYFRGRGGYEIAERDDGLIDVSSGPEAYFKPFKEWPTSERKAIALAGGRVLDVGCGAGRVALHLQSKGLDVTGIDNSPLAVEVCKARGLKSIKVMSVTQIVSVRASTRRRVWESRGGVGCKGGGTGSVRSGASTDPVAVRAGGGADDWRCGSGRP